MIEEILQTIDLYVLSHQARYTAGTGKRKRKDGRWRGKMEGKEER